MACSEVTFTFPPYLISSIPINSRELINYALKMYASFEAFLWGSLYLHNKWRNLHDSTLYLQLSHNAAITSKLFTVKHRIKLIERRVVLFIWSSMATHLPGTVMKEIQYLCKSISNCGITLNTFITSRRVGLIFDWTVVWINTLYCVYGVCNHQ